jgi:hypothetical protein
MMLHVVLPESWQPERAWIANVVLEQFLGLEHAITFSRTGAVRINAEGKSLTLSDSFFASGMRLESVPSNWAVEPSLLGGRVGASTVPILFGAPEYSVGATGAQLGIDIFGSAFFMLARYEEARRPERDRHGRFPAELSLAARSGFLDRPIIDEYVEILWAAMKHLWPGLMRKQRAARKLISCDVDLPFDPASASLSRLGKRMLGQLYHERSFRAVTRSVGNYWAVQRGDRTRDPYWHALSWMMDVNEKAGNQLTFNFIPEPTDNSRDNAPHLDDDRMRGLLRTIHARGHLIGIHPGYNTYLHPHTFARSVSTLRRTMEREGINQHELGGRQHYLRWDVNSTARLWAENSLTYDSTLAYSTVAGFRTGTCHEYTMYDLIERCPLAVKQRPLVVMENAVIDKCNMGLGHSEVALAAMQHYKQLCGTVDGDFTLLWHNSSFASDGAQAMYCDLIQ